MFSAGRRTKVLAVAVAGALIAISGPARAASEAVVYSFQGGSDGYYPYAGLLNVGGTLYGSTSYGGSVNCYEDGCGTVFQVSPSGAESVVYSFQGGSDGADPVGGLLDVGGIFYGTTAYGGASTACTGSPCGTVFQVTTSGTETVLHSFGSGKKADGATPYSGLISVGGKLYGTTNAAATVYSITLSGIEKVLSSFGGAGNGVSPYGGLLNVGGTLYGTTLQGGSGNCLGGCGTVFRVSRAGVESVLYSFQSGADAQNPAAGLINVGGTLYGTTQGGGGSANCNGGCGAVFKVSLSGVETVVYSFKGNEDGETPEASLIDVGGKLYGTTSQGGVYGVGVVFEVTPSGVEKVLHSFGSAGDGAYPRAALIDVGGTLYGTTSEGGLTSCSDASGCGTVFEVTP